ncbi:MAG: C-GCAxxG-C-C family protein [Bacteroidales bacterium]|nr:C-GCAxxG-C-C family protein [Bacteroidales bacterium]
MDKKERALSFFREGYNCAQAVTLTFTGENSTAANAAAGFGGGMGRMQNTCGALTGAYILFGLRHGTDGLPSEEEKKKVYDLVRNLNMKFVERNGTDLCSELLGEDINTPAGKSAIESKGLTGKVCEKCIGDVVEIIEIID